MIDYKTQSIRQYKNHYFEIIDFNPDDNWHTVNVYNLDGSFAAKTRFTTNDLKKSQNLGPVAIAKFFLIKGLEE